MRFVRSIAALSIAFGHALRAQNTPNSADSALLTYRERPSAMATPRFAALWTATSSQFQRTWDSASVADSGALEALRARLPAEVMERELVRLRFRRVWGRTTWPYFNWRETDDPIDSRRSSRRATSARSASARSALVVTL